MHELGPSLSRRGASAEPALTDLVSRETLQEIQDCFAALGRTSVCIGTVNGDPITRPTWGSRYSALIGTSPHGAAIWLESVRACARQPQEPASRSCLEGMTLYSAPIVHDDRQLAMLVVGTRDHDKPGFAESGRICQAYGIDCDDFHAAVAELDPKRGGTPADIQRFADVLAELLGRLYGQAKRISRQLVDLQTVHDLSQLLSGTVDLQSILDRTVHRVVEVMQVKACAIRLLNVETGELVIKAVANLSDAYLNKGAVLLQNSPIDAAAFRGESVYMEDVPTDPRIRYPANALQEGLVSGLCVSLTYRGQTIGVIRVYTGRKHVFDDSETSLLRSISSQAAAAIIHSRLFEQQTKSERVRRQMETAGQVQRRMLPRCPPPRDGFEFAAVYDPSLAIGGDFYDFIDLPDGDLGLCIADVSGKGIPAALFMASIRSTLRAYAPTSDDVTRIIRHVNRQMCNDTLIGEFTTLFYGVLSRTDRTLNYCNAGHQAPLILRRDGFIDLRAGGMAIGIRPNETYERERVVLSEGDLLIMTTDGVTDAMNFEGQSYGSERLLASIWKHRRLDAAQLVQQLQWDVRRFVGLADQADDITIVVVKAV